MIMTGPAGSAAYFEQIDAFIGLTLGEEAQSCYQIITGDPDAVARAMSKGLQKVRKWRIANNDAFYFNWLLEIPPDFQIPFEPTHDNMANLRINREVAVHDLAADLRRAFSGIVAGNVKPEGLKSIREHGHFEIRGDAEIMRALDDLLAAFVADNRMKIPGGSAYEPCYRVIANN